MKLFYKRFCDDWRNQVKTINWVVPPIIWIYFVIPISLLLCIYYYHIWYSTQLYWNEFIPLGVFYLVLFIFISPGNIRSYLLDADLIFLIQNPKVMTKIRICGFLATLLKSLLLLLLLMLIILPILINIYQVGVLEIGTMFLIVLAYKVVVLIIRRHFENPLIQHLSIAGVLMVFLLMGTLVPEIVSGVLSLIIFGIGIAYFTKEAKMNRRFIREVEIEKQERNKLNQLVFVASANFIEEAPVIEYPSLFGSPSEPRFLFPKSRRIFKKRTPENDLLEFCLKAFIRNRTLRSIYFKVIGFPYFAVFILPIILQGLFQTILPIWIRLLFYPVMLYALYKLTEILYWKLVHHSFFEVVPIDKSIKYSPQKRFQIWLILPIAILTAFIWLYLDFPYNILPLALNAFIL